MRTREDVLNNITNFTNAEIRDVYTQLVLEEQNFVIERNKLVIERNKLVTERNKLEDELVALKEQLDSQDSQNQGATTIYHYPDIPHGMVFLQVGGVSAIVPAHTREDMLDTLHKKND